MILLRGVFLDNNLANNDSRLEFILSRSRSCTLGLETWRPRSQSWFRDLKMARQTQFGEDRCTQFRVIVVTDPHRPSVRHRQERLQKYTAPQLSAQCNEKKRPERRKHCALAVVAEPKMFAPPQTPFPGARDGQNLISWRWSLRLPTDPVWWGSMHAISSYRGNRPTHPQTGPITIHCAAS